ARAGGRASARAGAVPARQARRARPRRQRGPAPRRHPCGALISPASCGTNRAAGAHNVLLARPNRRTFADYNEELRCGSRVLLDRVLLARRTPNRGWWRADALRQHVERHPARGANNAPTLGVILTPSS